MEYRVPSLLVATHSYLPWSDSSLISIWRAPGWMESKRREDTEEGGEGESHNRQSGAAGCLFTENVKSCIDANGSEGIFCKNSTLRTAGGEKRSRICGDATLYYCQQKWKRQCQSLEKGITQTERNEPGSQKVDTSSHKYREMMF